MAKIAVKHAGMTDPDAKKIPPRTPIAPGVYQAAIVNVQTGLTKTTPSLQKLTVEFQVLYNAETKDEGFKNRRVYQDYVLEPGSNEEANHLQRARLVQLLDAAKVPYDATGFDDEDLKSKAVKITVRTRQGTQQQQDGTYPVFANVAMVDAPDDVNPDDLL